MAEISVIVPVYKVEKYLNECIDSILQQTFRDFELVLIDDGSPDNCGKICDQYTLEDDRVRVIHQQNAGVSHARNVGLNIAEGNYISFVDSDDVVNKHYLGRLYEKAIEFQADTSICEMKEFIDEKEAGIIISEDIKKDDVRCLSGREAALLLYSTPQERIEVVSCAKMYKKSLFEGLRFPVGKRHEDDATTPILLQKSKNVVCLTESLYGYRQRADSFMHESFSLKRYDVIASMDRCITYFSDVNEIELAAVAKKSREAIIAHYALLTRKAGIYKSVPQEYRMSRFRAIRTMRALLPYNLYSYRLAEVYPWYVFIESRIRRTLQMVGIVKTEG